jgi:hypothetical protein
MGSTKLSTVRRIDPRLIVSNQKFRREIIMGISKDFLLSLFEATIDESPVFLAPPSKKRTRERSGRLEKNVVFDCKWMVEQAEANEVRLPDTQAKFSQFLEAFISRDFITLCSDTLHFALIKECRANEIEFDDPFDWEKVPKKVKKILTAIKKTEVSLMKENWELPPPGTVFPYSQIPNIYHHTYKENADWKRKGFFIPEKIEGVVRMIRANT